MDNVSPSSAVELRAVDGRVPFQDKAVAVFITAAVLPAIAISCLIRWLIRATHYPLKTEFLLAFFRNIGKWPLSIRRTIGRSEYVADIRQSKRFSGSSPALGERVSRTEFAGYWVCRGSVKMSGSPSRSDVTLLWIHGGAYVAGHPLENLDQKLRVAEVAAEKGVSINIFVLQYTLAPEAVFPRQIDQAVASYRYLVEEIKIDPNRVAVIGESAGGHLALSLLCELATQGLPRPGKAVLIYPWVNLTNSGATFVTNKYKDSLNKKDLDRCADYVLGRTGRQNFPLLLNFASSSLPEGRTWSRILPPTWIAVGSHDVFVADITDFVTKARADGAQVELHVEEGMPHGWLGYYDVINAKQYRDLSPSDDAGSIMMGAELIAKVVMTAPMRE